MWASQNAAGKPTVNLVYPCRIPRASRQSARLRSAGERQGALVDDVASLDDGQDGLAIVDVGGRIGGQQHRVGDLAFLDAAHLILLAQEARAIEGGDLDDFQRRDPPPPPPPALP